MTERDFEHFIDDEPLSLVFFQSLSCSGCWEVKGIMDDFEQRGFRVHEVAAHKRRDLVEKYSVTKVPTVIIFNHGRVKAFIEGPQMRMVYEKHLE